MYDTETTATELKQWMETGYASDPTGQMHARVRTPQPLFLHFSTALGAETKQKKKLPHRALPCQSNQIILDNHALSISPCANLIYI
jgi:hypothetical protein